MGSSKSEIDRLGKRLRDAEPTEAELRSLDEYRSSFDKAYLFVMAEILRALPRRKPSGRPRKTTESIKWKLIRETIRLSQVQDVAGCRLVVKDVKQQVRVVAELQQLFGKHTTVNRRLRPSHGYRAVHVIVMVLDRPIEIQVRTELQDLWAQLSEAMSDAIDRNLKYGAGPEKEQNLLETLSRLVYEVETGRMRGPSMRKATRDLLVLFRKQ